MSLIQWLPWFLWPIFTIIWCIGFGYLDGSPSRGDTLARVLGWLGEHWFPVALLVVVYFMAAGYVGADLGIPMLFRDDPAVGFNQNSPALWWAFGATVLLGEVWIIVYLFEYIGHYHRLDPDLRQQGWDPPGLWANPSKRLDKFRDYRSALQFLAVSTPPFLLLYGLAAALPAKLVGGPAFRDVLIYLLGALAGSGMVAVMVCVGWWLALQAGRVGLLRQGVERSICLLRTRHLTPEADPQLDMRLAITASFWVFLVVIGLSALIMMTLRIIVPSVAISMLFGLILALYFILISLRRSFQFPFLIILVVYISWSNSGAYKYRFPGMGTIDGASHYARGNLLPADLSEAEGPGPEKPLLDNVSVLSAWKEHLGDKRPKLVLVVVTGGAYRAGFWTAAVLDELEHRSRLDDQLKGLTDRIRVITGASGGMVGAAYFETLRGVPGTTIVDTMIADSRRDSLTPVIQQLVQRDIPMIFCPIAYQRGDRGVKLEDQWKTLKHPFSTSYDDEKMGRRPSLIVSPMVIETGERMLISNLDLEDISTPVSATGELYLSSARQFFQMFPAAQPTFGLHTAVRMSATFPYASPAVSLPTNPPRRVVDAGYYDNYGVNLAAAWAYQYRDWIRRETSGLALIQIYAYPRTGPSGEVAPGEATPKSAAHGGAVTESMERSFNWLSSPIEGALGARNWSMLYRNEEQLRLLDDTFNKSETDSRMFETFVFANPGGAAMNWIVALDDIRDMRRSIAGGRETTNEVEKSNNIQMAKLIAWWNNRPYTTGQKRAIPAPDRLQRTEFEASSALTPYIQKRLNSTISRYRVYMHNLGFTPNKGWIKVRIGTDPSDKINAFYKPTSNTIVVGTELARDKDPVLREYTHHILIGQGMEDWGGLRGVESGLADYFPCSFQGDPEFGERIIEVFKKLNPEQFNKPYLRTMDNRRRFDELDELTEEHDEGEVWGGAFWELRQKLGKDDRGNHLADVLLLRTAQNLKLPARGSGARAEFVRQLLEQERRLSGGRFASQIREVFQGRGLKL